MGRLIPIEMKSPQLNLEFADYLRGKSVAIVGRAGRIHEIEQGEFIDSHDVVVRFHRAVPYRADYNNRAGVNNDGTPHYVYEWFRYDIRENDFVPEDWQSRLGRKTNVYYHRLRNGNRVWIGNYVQKFKEAGGKFMCFTIHGAAHPHHLTVEEFIDVRYLDWEIVFQTMRLIGGNIYPLEGTWTIVDVLRHDIESAYITGFPCYCDQDMDYHHGSQLDDLRFLHSLCSDRVRFDPNMMELFDKYCKGTPHGTNL